MDFIFVLTLVAALFLGIFRILEKPVGLLLHPLIGAIFIYITALTSTFLAFLILRPEVRIDAAFKKGIMIAFLAGLFIAAFDILLLLVIKRGGSISLLTPIVNAGSILFVALVGFLLFRESLNPVQIVGILIIIIGIFLVTK